MQDGGKSGSGEMAGTVEWFAGLEEKRRMGGAFGNAAEGSPRAAIDGRQDTRNAIFAEQTDGLFEQLLCGGIIGDEVMADGTDLLSVKGGTMVPPDGEASGDNAVLHGGEMNVGGMRGEFLGRQCGYQAISEHADLLNRGDGYKSPHLP